ncbi:hypothetical protein [Trueperella bialowiezensis]|uniref:Uncharacterized protein n=1 Tax=Trueperella bialowiezensis TaxID=312285 RepID=A0A3S4WG94_9ACTO|nr:hypothetical protein [Trueperella bialowiezensis]VEI13243.1 Uncharacterised protein [Trueperella bialowiezensis]
MTPEETLAAHNRGEIELTAAEMAAVELSLAVKKRLLEATIDDFEVAVDDLKPHI